MPFTYEKIRYLGEDCIEITGFEGSVRSLTIPDRIEGLAVRSSEASESTLSPAERT